MKWVWLGASALLTMTASAHAQDAPTTGDTPPPQPVEVSNPDNPAPVADAQVYTAADFTRFAPRNALDMLRNVPGFTIVAAEQLRGLGQASGNVLINGARLSSKSDDIVTQLTRIPANTVARIEIVDGATLDLPGLSGQVANLIVRADTLSGQFGWRPNFRPHNTHPRYTLGEVSVSGRTGPIQFEVGLANAGGGGGANGPTLIRNAAGTVTEVRDDMFRSVYDAPKLSGRINYDGPGTMVATLNAAYQQIFNRYNEDGIRRSPGSADRLRTVRQNSDGWNREFGGDIDFALGPGRLKLIGLDRASHEPYTQTIVTRDLASGTVQAGQRYAQVGDITERIARAEYSWKLWGADWQLSGEAAYNNLENVAEIATLDLATNSFNATPLPGGTGGVDEDRYEGLLSFSRPLTPKLSLQLVGGAEVSTLAQTGPGGLTRRFVRPKGSLSLAWKATPTFDLSAKLRRRVLQLSFYDFLARVFLNDDNQNSGNADLVPQQDWSLEVELNKRLGAWGSTKIRLIYRNVQDYIDVIPIGTGESTGNIPRATAAAVDWTATIQFDPLGWKGAKLDTRVLHQRSAVNDPLTGFSRQYSNFTDTLISAALRWDVPSSDWAVGGSLEYSHNQPAFRIDSIDRAWEGPVFDGLFVEHKNLRGLTVRAGVTNLLNARSRRERTVWTGRRTGGIISFTESRDRLIGPIFNFSVRGSF